MTDKRSATPGRAPPKAIACGALAAIIAAAVIAIAPVTKPAEGLRLVPYLDPALIATECYGHTGPDVHLGGARTLAECAAEYRADMTAHMTAAVKVTPLLLRGATAIADHLGLAARQIEHLDRQRQLPMFRLSGDRAPHATAGGLDE